MNDDAFSLCCSINNSSYTLSVKPSAYSMSHLHENSEGKHHYPYHADEEAESQEGYISRPGSQRWKAAAVRFFNQSLFISPGLSAH